MEFTDKKYWKKNWKNLKLPARFGNQYSRRVISSKILNIIKENKISIFTTIELGGCPGKWAEFFNRKFEAFSDIIEYEKHSAKITEKNFKLLKIKGKVYNEDAFKNTAPKNYYDIVISSGLVEHFDKLDLIFKKHIELARPGGLVIISVPNLENNTFYSRHIDTEKSLKIQRPIDILELKKATKDNNLKVFYLGYLGVLNYGLTGPDKRIDDFKSKLKTLFYISVEKLLRVFSIKRETKFYSPNIYLIAQKPYED